MALKCSLGLLVLLNMHGLNILVDYQLLLKKTVSKKIKFGDF